MLNYKKPALWAVILLVVAAAIIGVCLLTKPAENDAGVPDAETLYALRTEYIGDNAAVSGILDALGFRAAGAAGDGQAYTYSFEVETASEPYGVVVRYAFTGALPQRSAEWNRQMAQRGYIALALIDNAEWLRWEDIGAEGETPVSGTVYAGDYVAADYNAVRESAAGLQALMDVLQARLEDGSIVYYPGDALPDFTKITPWPILGEDGVVSAKAEDYGIVYDAAQLPDWETVPLSYLCAYYLNADGAYAEGAMDVLAQRYSQLPQQVRRYIWTLSGQADPRGNGDAAEALLRDISRYITSQLTGGLPVTVSYEKDQLSIAVTEVYSVVYRRADGAVRGPGHGWTVRCTVPVPERGGNGGAGGLSDHVGDGRFRQAGRAADGGAGAGHPVGEGTGAAGVASGLRHPAPQRRGRCPLLGHCRLPRAAHGAENTDGAVRLYLRDAGGFPGQYDFRQAGVLRRRDVHRRQGRPARPAEDAHQHQRLRRRSRLLVHRQADGDVRRRADSVGAEGDGQLRQLYVRLVELRHSVRQREPAVLADIRRAL